MFVLRLCTSQTRGGGNRGFFKESIKNTVRKFDFYSYQFEFILVDCVLTGVSCSESPMISSKM